MQQERFAYCRNPEGAHTLAAIMKNQNDDRLEMFKILDAVVRLHIDSFRLGLTHRDNHADNILIVFNRNVVEAKFIDLGKARVGFDKTKPYSHHKPEDLLHDLKYLFFNKSHNIFDRFVRWYREFEARFRSKGVISNPQKQQKHYPCRRMMDVFASQEIKNTFEKHLESQQSLFARINKKQLADDGYRNEIADTLLENWRVVIQETLDLLESQEAREGAEIFQNQAAGDQNRQPEVDHFGGN